MSRLSDLYQAIDVLRKEGLSLSEELERQIAEAEEEVIKNEILPIITETIASSLQQVQRELVLMVNYVPGEPVTVHISRQHNFTQTVVDAKEVTPPDPEVQHKVLGPKKTKGTKAPATRLRVTFGDGTVIEEPKAAETFQKFVMKVGVDKVRSVGIIRNKIPLVSNTLDSKYQSQQREVADGWYLVTCTTTPSKKKDMEKIASALGLNVKVEEI